MIRRICIMVIVLCFALSMFGCEKRVDIGHDDIELIKIEDFTEQVFDSGRSYSFILKNDTDHVIVQNNVYISYAITNEEKTSFKMNNSKVEATNNKLNILPGESITLFAFIPKENYETNKYISSDRPNIEIKGYFNELKDTNHFTRYGGISMFDE